MRRNSFSQTVQFLSPLLFIVIAAVSCSGGKFAASQKAKGQKNSQPPVGSGEQNPELIVDATNTVKKDNFGQGQGQEVILKNVSFALLINDVTCSMCHMKVQGNVVSTGAVGWHDASVASIQVDSGTNDIEGAWYAASTFADTSPNGTPNYVNASDGIHRNYSGAEMPKNNIYPLLDLENLNYPAVGLLKASSPVASQPGVIKNSIRSNLVLVGTAQNPIEIKGEIHVKGDVVIKGTYKGSGTIYATGNIYIPANLMAQKSALRHSRTGADTLGLAGRNIFIGNIQSPIYSDARAPAIAKADSTGIHNVYSWYYRPLFEALHESAAACDNGSPVPNSFELVEAFLYAKESIGGVAKRTSWTIFGGLITQAMHIIGGGGRTTNHGDQSPYNCSNPNSISAVHGQPQNGNHLIQDPRIEDGLPVLSQLSKFFEK